MVNHCVPAAGHVYVFVDMSFTSAKEGIGFSWFVSLSVSVFLSAWLLQKLLINFHKTILGVMSSDEKWLIRLWVDPNPGIFLNLCVMCDVVLIFLLLAKYFGTVVPTVLVMSLCTSLTLQNKVVLGRGLSSVSAFLFELVSLTVNWCVLVWRLRGNIIRTTPC